MSSPEASAQRLPDSKYITADISDELYREVVRPDGTVYRINNPKTHRVVDADGLVHCYAAPESGVTILRWKAREGLDPVKF
jgi:hypothetical protein